MKVKLSSCKMKATYPQAAEKGIAKAAAWSQSGRLVLGGAVCGMWSKTSIDATMKDYEESHYINLQKNPTHFHINELRCCCSRHVVHAEYCCRPTFPAPEECHQLSFPADGAGVA